MPKFIMRMTEVTGTEKTVLTALFDRMRPKKGGGGGDCFPKQSTIAKDVGSSVRTVRRALRKWKDLGILSWSRMQGRTYYYILAIPPHFKEKYGDEAVKKNEITRRKENEYTRSRDAANVFQLTKDRIQEHHIKETEGNPRIISEDSIKGPEKDWVNSDVYQVAKYYSDVFKNKFSNTAELKLVGKEMGQIKTFVALCGSGTAKNIISDIFANWDYYKIKWKIESDYPTVGVIVTYGKGMIIRLGDNRNEVLVDSDIEMPGSGWQ
jgi:hypothetical protein